MMFLSIVNRVSVKIKLLVAFSLVAITAAVMGVVGTFSVYHIDHQLIRVQKNIVQPLQLLVNVSTDFQKIRVNVRQLMDITDEDDADDYISRIESLHGINSNAITKYKNLILDEEETVAFNQFTKTWDAYNADVVKAIEMHKKGRAAEAKIYMLQEGGMDTARAAQKSIETLVKLKGTQAVALSVESSKKADLVGYALIGLGALGFVVAMLIGVISARNICVPLESLREKADAIARGDLTVEIDNQRSDEIGALCQTFEKMAQNLRETVQQMSKASIDVTSSSTELTDSARWLSSATDSLTSQSTTIATASEELAATSGTIEQSCHQAAGDADQAAKAAESGLAVAKNNENEIKTRIEETRANARAISALGERSDQIGAIVSTINDIADQTNLLALNAAIEAARAGEQGRGFAVVADEVRALAERTSGATKEIGSMIRAIQTETRHAVDAMESQVRNSEQSFEDARNLGASLEKICGLIHEVTMQVNQIATAAEEQTSTTSGIASNTVQMAEVVETSADRASGVAGLSARLYSTAEHMKKLVSEFRF